MPLLSRHTSRRIEVDLVLPKLFVRLAILTLILDPLLVRRKRPNGEKGHLFLGLRAIDLTGRYLHQVVPVLLQRIQSRLAKPSDSMVRMLETKTKGAASNRPIREAHVPFFIFGPIVYGLCTFVKLLPERISKGFRASAITM